MKLHGRNRCGYAQSYPDPPRHPSFDHRMCSLYFLKTAGEDQETMWSHPKKGWQVQVPDHGRRGAERSHRKKIWRVQEHDPEIKHELDFLQQETVLSQGKETISGRRGVEHQRAPEQGHPNKGCQPDREATGEATGAAHDKFPP